MEKDSPSFFEASQHPKFFLSMPLWRAGPAVAHCVGCGKDWGSGCAPDDVGDRQRASSPKVLGTRMAHRGG
jgi:hypothetical protein